jgi:hypothetical protein
MVAAQSRCSTVNDEGKRSPVTRTSCVTSGARRSSRDPHRRHTCLNVTAKPNTRKGRTGFHPPPRTVGCRTASRAIKQQRNSIRLSKAPTRTTSLTPDRLTRHGSCTRRSTRRRRRQRRAVSGTGSRASGSAGRTNGCGGHRRNTEDQLDPRDTEPNQRTVNTNPWGSSRS